VKHFGGELAKEHGLAKKQSEATLDGMIGLVAKHTMMQ